MLVSGIVSSLVFSFANHCGRVSPKKIEFCFGRWRQMLNDRHPETRTASFMRSLSARKILRMNWFLFKYPNKNSTIFPVAFQQQFFVKGNFFYQVYSWNHIGTMNILGQPEFGSHWLTVRIAQEAVDLCMQTLKEAKYDRGTTAGQKWLGHGNTRWPKNIAGCQTYMPNPGWKAFHLFTLRVSSNNLEILI